MKLSSIPLCMVQGHDWVESRQLTGFETCRRCRSRRRRAFAGPPVYAEVESVDRGELPRTITVAARKGGSGKSTIALHLALAAHLRGHHVMLADTDVQRSSTEALDARPDADRLEAIPTRGTALRMLHAQAAARGVDYLIIDTPAGPGPDLTLAMMLSDLNLLVARPSFLDIAAAVRSFYEARTLDRPATILLNQAPPARNGQESAAVGRALEALRHTRLPAAPVIMHARTAFQTAVARGCSVEELGASPAADEVAALWRHVETMLAEGSGAGDFAVEPSDAEPPAGASVRASAVTQPEPDPSPA